MDKSSIAFKINIGISILVGLLLLLGIVAFLGVGGMMGSVSKINNSMVTLNKDLQLAIQEISTLDKMMDLLGEADTQFTALKAMQSNLKSSKEDTAEIGTELQAIENTFTAQSQHLETIRKNTAVLTNEFKVMSGPIKELTRGAEEINARILNAYIGFFNYLNEYTSDTESPLADIEIVYSEMEKMTALLENEKITILLKEENHEQILTQIRKNLKRFRYYMRALGETTSTTQISELKTSLIQYGSAILQATQSLRQLSYDISDKSSQKQQVVMEAAEKSAQDAESENISAASAVKVSVTHAKTSSDNLGNMTQQLSSAITGMDNAMSVLPEAIGNATNAVAKIEKTIPVMEQGILESKSSVGRAKIISILMILVCLSSVGFGIYVGLSINKKIVKPLSRFTSKLHEASKNNLTVAIDPSGTDGELQSLIIGTNNLINNFKNSVKAIKRMSDRVADNAHTLQKTAEQTALSLADQNTQTDEVTHATGQLSTASGEIAKNVSETEIQSLEVAKLVEHGGKTINEMTTLTKEINESLKIATEKINGLRSDSEKIGSIITIINDISDQTNLLALNATIEAARAGTHGKGFAVVAEEVKQLAKKTADSTRGVSQIIKDVREKIDPTLSEMARCGEKVDEDEDKCQEVNSRLDSISASVEVLLSQTALIATATEEQSATFPEVSGNLAKISNISKHTGDMMDNIGDRVIDLNKLSEELLAELAVFKVD